MSKQISKSKKLPSLFQSFGRKNIAPLTIVTCLVAALPLLGNSLYIQAKAQLAQHLIADAWKNTLKDNQQQQNLRYKHRPWSWSDSYPVAKLRVPSHNIEQYILQGATGSSLAFAPGLYAGTRLPGEKHYRLESIIAGHHNTHFSFLKYLKIGDKIQLQTFTGEWQWYKVDSIAILNSRTQKLPVFKEENYIQLVTCSPNFIGEVHPDNRLVIKAVLDSPYERQYQSHDKI